MFDIKSGNVLLDDVGVIAKISDVGLSKIMAGSNTATLLVSSSSSYPMPLLKPNPFPAHSFLRI